MGYITTRPGKVPAPTTDDIDYLKLKFEYSGMREDFIDNILEKNDMTEKHFWEEEVWPEVVLANRNWNRNKDTYPNDINWKMKLIEVQVMSMRDHGLNDFMIAVILGLFVDEDLRDLYLIKEESEMYAKKQENLG